jgi:hypothetical protein
MMLRIVKTAAVAVGALILVACASGPTYKDMASTIPALKSDQGRVYFYRESSMVGSAIQPDIHLNGDTVGTSQPGGFFYVDRPPGNYEAVCSTEVDRKATFTLAKGEERYIKTSVSMGFAVGHVTPELVDNSTGQAALPDLHYTGMATGK